MSRHDYTVKKKKNHIFILMVKHLPVEIYLQCELLVKALGNRVECLFYWWCELWPVVDTLLIIQSFEKQLEI